MQKVVLTKSDTYEKDVIINDENYTVVVDYYAVYDIDNDDFIRFKIGTGLTKYNESTDEMVDVDDVAIPDNLLKQINLEVEQAVIETGTSEGWVDVDE